MVRQEQYFTFIPNIQTMRSQHVQNVFSLPDKKFKQLAGITKKTFAEMYELLEAAYLIQHLRGGKPPRLSAGDRLLITLQYYREYRTMEHIALTFHTVVSRIHSIIAWVEQSLAADQSFTLPGKAALQNNCGTAAVDVTEHRLARPKKNKRIGIPARRNVIR